MSNFIVDDEVILKNGQHKLRVTERAPQVAISA